VGVHDAVTLDTRREAIETWLLLDGCRLPPRVFTIIDQLLDVIERQDRLLLQYRAGQQEDRRIVPGESPIESTD
jgi:hypothetical protein